MCGPLNKPHLTGAGLMFDSLETLFNSWNSMLLSFYREIFTTKFSKIHGHLNFALFIRGGLSNRLATLCFRLLLKYSDLRIVDFSSNEIPLDILSKPHKYPYIAGNRKCKLAGF